jgi:teichuronic acid biosynthesis glycosyltransferase TuaH
MVALSGDIYMAMRMDCDADTLQHMKVLFLSSARWSGERLSKQDLASALASLGHEILYVDPPVSPLSPIRDPGRARDLLSREQAPAQRGVRVWTPTVLPGQNSAVGQRCNARLLARGVRRRCPTPDVVVTFSLEARTLIRSLGGLHVYYCTDSTEDLPRVDREALRARELLVAHDADLVIACSRPLQRQLAARGVTSHYLPHGSEPPHRPMGGPVPASLRGLRPPILGYVGSLNFRVDAALLQRVLDEVDGTVVLVGGHSPAAGPTLSPAAQQLLRHPRVVRTGPVSSEDVSDYLNAFDIGLVPYVACAFNEKSFPLKVPQYLRAGLPVVSTPNGAAEEYADLVRLASTPEDFAAAVVSELRRDSDVLREARRHRAESRSWSVVADELLTLCSATR